VGPQLRGSIGALACKRDLTFAAVGAAIVECKRVHRTREYRGHDADIIQLLVLGDNLFSLGRDGKLCVWRIGDHSAPERVLHLPQGFVPTCMAHPDTYLNKMIVGAEDGRLQLWNFASGKLVHEFASVGAAVRCIVPSPALDVVGLGLSDG
jgi:U3 small nucleolar RNA-associated protein 21